MRPILENPEGRGDHRQNPFGGGRVWIFSGTTQLLQRRMLRLKSLKGPLNLDPVLNSLGH